MTSFVLRRSGHALLTLFLVLLITFGLTRIAYRNPAASLAPRNANQQVIDGISRSLRLSDPWYEQLWHFLVRGPEVRGTPIGLLNWPPSLGYSFRRQQPVFDLVVEKIPATLSLALGALALWIAFSLITGVLSASRPDSALDRGLTAISYLALSLPTFVVGVLLSYFLYYKLATYGIRWFPGSGYVPFTDNPWEWVRHLILPWLTIAIVEIGVFHRVVRSNMLEVLSQDYIRSARAKGVGEIRLHLDHALRSALNPIITLGGLELATIIGGAIVTEQIFGIDGVGRLAIESALSSDYPVVIGITLFAAVVFIVSNFTVDLVTQLRNPGRDLQHVE
ncbi:ABC transporter permease [Mycolicibacterium komossense]|uniref:ABC transporter permease n=1 Tax=Mycolicibacterium komossense TaxID=1779 RepID=A0ABT3CFF7_9MYCO|nr:ABC transporter permease [Mycolicibacterium komossense]MCV7228108.1 ABC transporter permease [Mycolicibacterium komossense]